MHDMATMAQPPEAATTPSALLDRTIEASLSAEIMTDPEDGELTLIAGPAGWGDVQVVTPSQLLAKVKEQREALDRIEALAEEYAAKVLIPQFVEQFNIKLIESDIDGLAQDAPQLASVFRGVAYSVGSDSFTAVVPKGQAAVVTLGVIRELVLDLEAEKKA